MNLASARFRQNINSVDEGVPFTFHFFCKRKPHAIEMIFNITSGVAACRLRVYSAEDVIT